MTASLLQGMITTLGVESTLKVALGRTWPYGEQDRDAPDRLSHPEYAKQYYPFQWRGLAWPSGLDVGVRSREGAIARPSLVFDTDDTFLVAQIAQPSAEPTSPFHMMVFRYDAEGTAIWPQAVSIPLKSGAAGQTAKMQRRHDGVVISTAERSVVIKPSGAFEPAR